MFFGDVSMLCVRERERERERERGREREKGRGREREKTGHITDAHLLEGLPVFVVQPHLFQAPGRN